ncbi:expressed protein [Batrachochytrium dendrobatidis JAM81]|uniref:Expressed protein n=2 Tax=Batrachochytrium dendrobatidis TaxID=109871 RepID=F4PB12_BATDJ|nr:uncharacterized protein BATDEDRAFT_37398 [Batrachochytrium dendrobatidis JAM81]EGF77773.1 expressed protein [Batrachochytrium dendrobatidis JAM81]KAJ8323767.1 hypothetical protein O5D80_007653 [Batrachochytrium dendrobatidis]KAK5666312.1 hypothetical protein QVD99_007073 [Batrachochytrium dendrobatidis]OAJ43124.1 hypothetical protein BDEG_26505 [Batrachochytrium dendrobatidis JEL423]|eukprot:XP_006681747.1 expressed protein [Batrachochytrium dendrobatidis JAM81]
MLLQLSSILLLASLAVLAVPQNLPNPSLIPQSPHITTSIVRPEAARTTTRATVVFQGSATLARSRSTLLPNPNSNHAGSVTAPAPRPAIPDTPAGSTGSQSSKNPSVDGSVGTVFAVGSIAAIVVGIFVFLVGGVFVHKHLQKRSEIYNANNRKVDLMPREMPPVYHSTKQTQSHNCSRSNSNASFESGISTSYQAHTPYVTTPEIAHIQPGATQPSNFIIRSASC